MEVTTTRRADYIVTELEGGSVAVITSPHDGSDASRFVFRDVGSARHWLRAQGDRDAGRRAASQGLMK